jgi:hypothetical protein
VAGVLLRRRWWIILPVAIAIGTVPTPDAVFAGAAAGLAAGLIMVAVHEYRDSSFSSDEDVSRVLTLPVLGIIPVMMSEPERHLWRYRRLARELVLILIAVLPILLALWRMRSAGR